MPRVPKEVVLEQYQLKSTFFAEKLGEMGFFGFTEKVAKLIADQGDAFDWADRKSWGISEDAWDRIEERGIHPLSVFCHPKILKLHPRFLRYYRCVAMLPQKGLQKIASVANVKEVEAGVQTLPEAKVDGVLRCLNELASAVVSLTPDLSGSKITGMMYATAGTTIDGSWRNQIGAEGERVIRSLLLKALIGNNEVLALVDKGDRSFSLGEWEESHGDPVATVNEMKTITVSNGGAVFFSSEPDVQFMDGAGKVLGAMEIKAGIDAAGALERLGAMLKSFDNVLSISPNAKTLLVATCITDEVEARLRESNAVSQIFITTDVINNKRGSGDKLANSVRVILGLIERRMR